uniref:Uncharacterized protein n=1 Tax=Glossina pallidipes TaxID=7398 RepID=A0A1B0AGC6_GLOPL
MVKTLIRRLVLVTTTPSLVYMRPPFFNQATSRVFVISIPSLVIRRPTPHLGSGAVVQYNSKGISPLFTVQVAETISFILIISEPKSKDYLRDISGVGLPPATHLKNTLGPGSIVSSGNVWRITGGSKRPPNFNSALASADS